MTGFHKAHEIRNREIFYAWRRGERLRAIAERNHLSTERVRQICNKQTRIEYNRLAVSVERCVEAAYERAGLNGVPFAAFSEPMRFWRNRQP